MIDTSYYDQEIAYLREAGQRFAEKHPQRAGYLRLDSPESIDPHIERLIECFAFLTARIRQRLDDDFPDLCGSLLSLVCPTLACPIPSCTVLEFTPREGLLMAPVRVDRGAEVLAQLPSPDGNTCRFRTTAPLEVYPLRIRDVSLARRPGYPPSVRVCLSLLEGVDSQTLKWPGFRFFVKGPLHVRSQLYALLHSEVHTIRVWVPPEENRTYTEIDKANWSPTPYFVSESLFPQPDYVPSALRLLQEYFVFPDRFCFFELKGLEFLSSWDSFSEVCIDLQLRSDPPPGLRFNAENLRLFCTPAVNLFSADGVPVAASLSDTDYRLEAAGGKLGDYEIYSVDRVSSVDVTSGEEIVFPPFHGFLPSSASENQQSAASFAVIRRPGADERGECWLRFVTPLGKLIRPPSNILSISLTCTNGNNAEALRRGELSTRGEGVPESVSVSNLGRPTPFLVAPLFRQRDTRYWHLLGHVTSNYLSLINADVLKETLELFAGHAGLGVGSGYSEGGDIRRGHGWRRRLNAIKEVRTSPAVEVYRGSGVCGTRVTVVVKDEADFEFRGELLQFMSVLAQFLNHYASLNSFVELVLDCRKPVYQEVWPWKAGTRVLL